MPSSGFSGKIVALSLLSGLISGAILLVLNFTLLNPYYEFFSNATLDELIASGAFDEEVYYQYDQSQILMRISIPIAIGLAFGAIVGLAYTYSRGYIFRFSVTKRAILIAGIAWFVLFVIPTLKYPIKPFLLLNEEFETPLIDASYLLLFFGYVAVSALAAIAVSMAFRKVKRQNKVFGAAALYMIIISIAFILFPNASPDPVYITQNAINSFRSIIAAIMIAFWFILGAIAGILWEKYVPSESNAKQKN